MWPQSAQHSLRFRNALTLLEAGGYDVDVRQDGLVLRASRTGREWVCRTPEDFDSACAFHAWEAMGQWSQPASALVWTDAIPHDPAMQKALQSFYEKGYAIRITRGSIGYVDRLGRNWTFLSRDEFIAGVSRLGSEPRGRTKPSGPTLETRASLERRLSAMEARALAAEERAAALDQASARYEALKAALLDKVDPGRGRPQPEERARRSRFRTWLLRLVNRIEAVPAGYGVPTGACATAPRDVVASQMWKA